MIRLIDAPEFQRRRRIKQLGLGLYTYQGAEHSRFTHSLGAFHLMTRVLDRLRENYNIDLNDRAAARAAALLHDVGHGSYSYVTSRSGLQSGRLDLLRLRLTSANSSRHLSMPIVRD